MPSKITPIPSLAECVSRLQLTLMGMSQDIKDKTERVEQLKREREEIAQREVEVQALLDETGKRYQEMMSQGKVADPETATTSRLGTELVGDGGLESLGTAPRHPNIEDGL